MIIWPASVMRLFQRFCGARREKRKHHELLEQTMRNILYHTKMGYTSFTMQQERPAAQYDRVFSILRRRGYTCSITDSTEYDDGYVTITWS